MSDLSKMLDLASQMSVALGGEGGVVLRKLGVLMSAQILNRQSSCATKRKLRRVGIIGAPLLKRLYCK